MTSANGNPTSDSVNLGSNPSSPAIRNADISGISRNPGSSEFSESAEQTAHTGRTEAGTASPVRPGYTLSQVGLSLRWKRSASWIRSQGELVTHNGETWARAEYSSGRCAGYRLMVVTPVVRAAEVRP